MPAVAISHPRTTASKNGRAKGIIDAATSLRRESQLPTRLTPIGLPAAARRYPDSNQTNQGTFFSGGRTKKKAARPFQALAFALLFISRNPRLRMSRSRGE
jgi:hypothetical protein